MSKFAVAAIGAAVSMTMQADPALARCSPRCANIEASSQPTSIMPSPLDFSTGERFAGAPFRVTFDADNAFAISLPFEFQIGSAVFSTAYINRNGALTFGQSSPGLTLSGPPTIAAYLANLSEPLSTAAGPSPYGVYYEYGSADPYADSAGKYDETEARSAVRIVWYGVNQTSGPSTAGTPTYQIFAEIVLTGERSATGAGFDNSFAFRWGAPDSPGQVNYGGTAGFSFYDQAYTSAPDRNTNTYRTDVSFSTFDVQNGKVVSDVFGVPDTAVPEPDSWALMLLGFGLTGAALRRHRAGQAAKPSRNAATLAPSAATA